MKAEVKNTMYKAGFRFYVKGNFTETNFIDPRSGMPEIKAINYFFKNRKEAEEFANAQKYNTVVEKLAEHTETNKEKEAKEKERKEAKIQKELEKAQALGLTLEEYNKQKRKEAKIRKMRRELEELEIRREEIKKWLKENED